MSRLAEPCKVVPNVVPMIDIVSQLVIFFMLATQFISADVDALVKLPDLTDSQAQKSNDTNKMFLNVRVHKTGPDEKDFDPATGDAFTGGVAVPAQTPSEQQWTGLRKVLADYDQKSAKLNLNRVVVIRADRRLQWAFIFKVIREITQFNQDKVNKAMKDAQDRGISAEKIAKEVVPAVPKLDLRLCGPTEAPGG